jgi:hypothetical protein
MDLRTSSIAAPSVAFAEPHRWSARVVAQRGTDQAQWLPSGATQQQLVAAGVTIRSDRSHYELRFEANAPDLTLATRAVMARWARLCEVYALPDWPLMSLNVTHLDDQQDHAASQTPDTSRPVGPAGLTSTARRRTAGRSSTDGGLPIIDDRRDAALLVGSHA